MDKNTKSFRHAKDEAEKQHMMKEKFWVAHKLFQIPTKNNKDVVVKHYTKESKYLCYWR